jgi:hypothetical protein
MIDEENLLTANLHSNKLKKCQGFLPRNAEMLEDDMGLQEAAPMQDIPVYTLYLIRWDKVCTDCDRDIHNTPNASAKNREAWLAPPFSRYVLKCTKASCPFSLAPK